MRGRVYKMRGMRRDVPVPIPTCCFYAPMATSLPFLVLILQLAMSRRPGSRYLTDEVLVIRFQKYL